MRFLIALCFSAMPLLYSVAQPASLDYPTVYEGPDVIFRQIDEHLWVGSGFLANSESLYIVEGEERAVLIDTGTRIPGLDKIVESITSKPYDVILTHVHPDHAGGCANFDEVWLCEYDEATFPEMAPGFDGKVNYLKEGQVFDLGGRSLEVIFTPGHTTGSVTFIDRQNHYGFAGDSFGNGNLLLFTDFSTIIETLEKALVWMQANDIYYLYNGHFTGDNHETTKRIYDLKRICEDILSSKVEGVPGPVSFGIFDRSYSRDGLKVNYGEAQLK